MYPPVSVTHLSVSKESGKEHYPILDSRLSKRLLLLLQTKFASLPDNHQVSTDIKKMISLLEDGARNSEI